MRYTAGATVICVFLCVGCHFSSTTFLCETISKEEELLYSPRLLGSPVWIVPETQVCKACSSGEECGIFSNSGVLDLTKDIRAAIQ